VANIVAVDPIFAVTDLSRAVEHHRRLGFEISHYEENYAFAQRNGLTNDPIRWPSSELAARERS
jgi:hypothetical protein